MATPPGGRPEEGGTQRPQGGHSHHGYPFPAAPGRSEGSPSWSVPQPPQYQQYQQPYDSSYDPRYGPGVPGQSGGPGQPGGHGQPGPDPVTPQPAHHPGQPRPYQRRPNDGSGRRRTEPSGARTPSPLVRPYAMTGGRTRPRYQLAIEALVSTTADPARLQGQLPEHQRICRLCFEIKSVAEISALLSIPLGVARILVADLAEAGLVAIHQPGGDETAGGQPDVTLLERVLSGLRKL
ncbi:DUF742 domain-containing protein [Streptomyces sp. NPDC020875]|uniref:DUF742 domain-containing protein n=1 Tax=Streptomyces sp. NPDC020875 TaxID=3154898 RepID=UPI0033F87B5E